VLRKHPRRRVEQPLPRVGGRSRAGRCRMHASEYLHRVAWIASGCLGVGTGGPPVRPARTKVAAIVPIAFRPPSAHARAARPTLEP
jgi:hypothetical protein